MSNLMYFSVFHEVKYVVSASDVRHMQTSSLRSELELARFIVNNGHAGAVLSFLTACYQVYENYLYI